MVNDRVRGRVRVRVRVERCGLLVGKNVQKSFYLIHVEPSLDVVVERRAVHTLAGLGLGLGLG